MSLPLAHSNKVCLDILLTLSSSLAIETMMTMENKFESYMGKTIKPMTFVHSHLSSNFQQQESYNLWNRHIRPKGIPSVYLLIWWVVSALNPNPWQTSNGPLKKSNWEAMPYILICSSEDIKKKRDWVSRIQFRNLSQKVKNFLLFRNIQNN